MPKISGYAGKIKNRRARELELLKETKEILGEVKDDELGSPPGSEDYEKMYKQPQSEGGDPTGMKTGGMGSCPNRPDGIRGGGAAIAGMKFQGVK